MPSLDAISIFSQVAESQSFSEAARVLDIPLSTVSRKVSQLENDLNTRLLDRSRRQIRLTSAGENYLALCKKGLETLAYANKVISDRHSDSTGTVTITIPPNLAEVLFLPAVETFQGLHPQAKVRILVSDRLLDFVDDKIDLSFRVAQPRQPDLVAKTLLKYRHRLVATPDYASLHPLPKKVAELMKHRLIGFGLAKLAQVTWTLVKKGKKERLSFEPMLAINDYAAVKAAVYAGQGIGELPTPLCTTDLQTGRLIEVLPDWRLPEVKLYAVYAEKNSLSQLARYFLDITEQQMIRFRSRG